MEKVIKYLLLFIVLGGIVVAQNYMWLYNPYTGRLDRSLSLNQTGNDIIADNFYNNLSNSVAYMDYQNIGDFNVSGNFNINISSKTNIFTHGNVSVRGTNVPVLSFTGDSGILGKANGYGMLDRVMFVGDKEQLQPGSINIIDADYSDLVTMSWGAENQFIISTDTGGGAYILIRPDKGAGDVVLNARQVNVSDNIVVSGDMYVDTIFARNWSNVSIEAEQVEIHSIAGATYDNLNNFITTMASPGKISGGVITRATTTTVNISAGTGMIRAEDNDTSQLYFFDWPATNGLSIPEGTVKFVVVEYNGGTPRVIIYDTETWDLDSSFPLAKIVNDESTALHILNNPWWVGDSVANIIEALTAQGGIVYRDLHVGGLTLSVPGTRNIAVTAGTLWSRLTEVELSAFDTSVTGTIEVYWKNTTGDWFDADQDSYNVTHWNDPTQDTLQAMDNNKYAIWWVYAEADDKEITLIYPQRQFVSIGLAEAASAPSSLPSHIVESGILIGRIIFQKGVNVPIAVQNVDDTTFSASSATDHGNLAGLADDDHTQYIESGDDVSFGIIESTNYIYSTGAISGTTLDTGQGANELYDMNQNVLTTSSPTFVNVTTTGYFIGDGSKLTGISSGGAAYDQVLNKTSDVTFNSVNVTDCIYFVSGGRICSS